LSTLEERPRVDSSIRQDYTKRLMLFGGRASGELAARIAQRLDVDLGQADLRTFSNGEVYCRYRESIRGADVFIVQSTAANEREGLTPNDALMELLCMIDAAQGASAHRIIAVMPWYGYARQDKKPARSRASSTCRSIT
jgi:ribose-phosphate pyrophosphokinase